MNLRMNGAGVGLPRSRLTPVAVGDHANRAELIERASPGPRPELSVVDSTHRPEVPGTRARGFPRSSLAKIAASGRSAAVRAVALATLGVATLGAPLAANAQGAARATSASPPIHSPMIEAPSGASNATLDLSLPPAWSRELRPVERGREPRADYDFRDASTAGLRIAVGTAAGVALAERMYPGQPDKRLHAIAGGVVAGVTAEYVTWKTGNRLVGAAAGCAAALVAGVAKEAYDATGRGHVDRRDVVATAVGGAPVCLSYTIRF